MFKDIKKNYKYINMEKKQKYYAWEVHMTSQQIEIGQERERERREREIEIE